MPTSKKLKPPIYRGLFQQSEPIWEIGFGLVFAITCGYAGPYQTLPMQFPSAQENLAQGAD